ncbi:MAG: Trm112 family protein [Myxococcaceae bacterium]|nr:Trm112 family protein [Myxococcaceae bacterium]
MLDSQLLQALQCPADHGPLIYFAKEGFLYNPRLKRRYAIEDGIPQMIAGEATLLSDDEHQRLLDLAQREGLTPNF